MASGRRRGGAVGRRRQSRDGARPGPSVRHTNWPLPCPARG